MKYEQLSPLTILKEEASESRTNQVSWSFCRLLLTCIIGCLLSFGRGKSDACDSSTQIPPWVPLSQVGNLKFLFLIFGKKIISGEPGLFALAAKRSNDEYPPQRNSPRYRHESPGTLLETFSRPCVTSPHFRSSFLYFYLEFTLH